MTNDEILQIAKFISDLFGLITTLNLGMFGAIITIVEKVFTTDKVFKSFYNKMLLILSLLSFIFSLAFSLFALTVIPNNTKNMLLGKSNLWVDPFPFYGSIGLFFFGVLIFAILTICVFIAPTNVQQTPSEQQENVSPNKAKRGNKS